jgi:hypothetical protein
MAARQPGLLLASHSVPLTISRVHGLKLRLCRRRLACLVESPSLCEERPCSTRKNGRALSPAARLPLAQVAVSPQLSLPSA